jgi:hypothetical protein
MIRILMPHSYFWKGKILISGLEGIDLKILAATR